jgi:hypothetical protein
MVLGALAGSRAVADDLRRRSETALTAAGLGDVTVDFAGREAAVSGGNDVEARLAAALVAALPGVRTVEDRHQQTAPLPGVARFELDRAGDDVEISGAVPSPDDAAAIKVGVATTLRTVITGDVAVDRSVDVARWAAALPAVLEIVVGVEGLELDIPGDGTLRLGGEVSDAATRSRILGQVADALPELKLVDALGVVGAPRAGG